MNRADTELSMASPEPPKRVILAVGVFAVIVVACSAYAWFVHIAPSLNSVTGQGSIRIWAADGGETDCLYGMDGFGRIRIVLFVRTAPRAQKVPVARAAQCVMTSVFPADPSRSGLYINGAQQRMEPGLQVYYMSDSVACTRIDVTSNERDSLVRVLEGSDREAAVEEYIADVIMPSLEE